MSDRHDKNRAKGWTEGMARGLLPGLLLLFFALSGSPVLAAGMESESKHTFRGGGANTLPLRPVKVYAPQDAALPASLLRASLLLQPVSSASEADLRIVAGQKGRVRLEKASGGGVAGRSEFVLPGEQAALRETLEGHARFLSVAKAKGSLPWPELAWTIRVYSPAARDGGETIRHDKKLWSPVQVLDTPEDGTSARLDGPALLAFSFVNSGRSDCYVHILNYTEDGLVLPVLPPAGQPGVANLVRWGTQLTPPGLLLELSAPTEYVRLIVSEKPLDISALAQESFSSGPLAAHGAEAAAAPEADWRGVEVIFRKR